MTPKQYQTWRSPARIFVTTLLTFLVFSHARTAFLATDHSTGVNSGHDNPVDVEVPKDALGATIDSQPSPTSITGSPCSGSADIVTCPSVRHAAGDGITGTGVLAGSGAPVVAFLRDMSVRQTEQFAILTNGIASMQRQISELIDVTNRTTEWMHAQQARSVDIDTTRASLRSSMDALQSASCRICEVRLEQTAFSEPHSRRECRHFPASKEKAKAFLLAGTGINKTKSSLAAQCCSYQIPLWSEQGLCSEVLCPLPP